jgi:AMP deaminase
LAELARNSVIQSGFEMEIKRHWLGQKWYLPGAAGNDINKVCVLLVCHASSILTIGKTNVPNIRLAFRHKTLMEELKMISSGEKADPDNLDGSSPGK